MKTEYIKKHYQFRKTTIDKINKLKTAQELENYGINIYEKTVVSDAIDLAYSAKFGKEIFEETMTKLDTIISSTVNNLLIEHLRPYAKALSNIYEQTEITKEAMLLLLVANNVVDVDAKILAKNLEENQDLEFLIAESLDIRKGK
ncbi:MAG: hypothetical protein ACK5KR_00740 [Breznakia sp.]